MDSGLDGRQVALDVDDDLDLAVRIERCSASKMRSEPDSWSARVITASKPCVADRIEHAWRIGRHDDAAEPAFAGAGGDMDDHRPAGDIGQRLARQARRGHAGGDEDQGGHRGCESDEKSERPKVAKRLTGTALIGVATS